MRSISLSVLLENLNFAEMRTREEQLRSVDVETIDWVWSEETTFARWLSAGKDIFWISGKPASGKSTLMNCLANHEMTPQFLRVHKNAVPWIVIRFFFDFRAGKGLANNLDGLLRSLLLQLVERISIFCPS